MSEMPTEMAGGMTLDPSVPLLSGYLLLSLAGMIVLATFVGVATLPGFFIALFALEQGARAVAATTGSFWAKLVLIMFRGLRRSPLRTSLTYIALFVLTSMLVMLYAILNVFSMATTEKASNLKAIVTHKTLVPSQMKPAVYDQFRRVCLEELPPGSRPVNGDKDLMAWSFVGGTTDKSNPRPENALFMFCSEPSKITTMMDGLDDLTGQEKELLDKGVAAMEANKQAIIVSENRLKKMNLRVGQRIKLYGLNYPDVVFEFDVVGSLPAGKYDGVGFMNSVYLNDLLKQKPADYVMQDKSVNLIWVRLPDMAAFERLTALVDDPGRFNNPPLKVETASSGLGSMLEPYKDILWGLKFILTPAMVGIMCLVIANALSISVRERRTELAVLKVLGFQPRHVLLMVLGEAVLVGGMAGGMAAGLMTLLLELAKIQLIFWPLRVPSVGLLLGPGLGVAVSVAGSLLPALRARRVKVAEVFARVA